MFNLLFAAFVLVFTVQCFQQNYLYSRLDQVYLGLYKGLPEKAVVLFDEEGNPLETPMFHIAYAQSLYKAYLEANLSSYPLVYSYSVRGPIQNLKRSTTIVFTLKSTINPSLAFSKKAVFAIERTENE